MTHNQLHQRYMDAHREYMRSVSFIAKHGPKIQSVIFTGLFWLAFIADKRGW